MSSKANERAGTLTSTLNFRMNGSVFKMCYPSALPDEGREEKLIKAKSRTSCLYIKDAEWCQSKFLACKGNKKQSKSSETLLSNDLMEVIECDNRAGCGGMV
jgi:hypothetical protein